jgi:choline kinase
VKAIILAAGRGSRMGTLTEAAPKCLTPLAGRPLLEWQLDALRGGGIESVGVVRGYKPHLLDGRGLVTFDNSRWAETNMVASLACAASWLQRTPVIVSYSDIFYPASAVKALAEARSHIAISYDPQWLALWSQRFEDPLSDAETFRLDGNRVVEIGRRATTLEEIRGQYMGLLKITPAGWAVIETYRRSLPPERRDRLDMTGLLAGLIDEGHRVDAVPVSGPWGEVDNANDLAVYERLIADGRLAMAS